MKKVIITASIAMTLASGLQAVTLEELDARLNAAETTISTMRTELNTVNAQIAELQSFHLSTREFSVTSDSLYTLGAVGFADQIASLNFTDGEWLYVKAQGDMKGDGTINTSEMCTSDSRLTSYLSKYSDTTLDPMVSTFFNVSSGNELTYTKSDINTIDQTWDVATNIHGEVLDFERLKLGASGINGGLNVDIFPNSYLVHFYNSSPTNIATYRAGKTRLEACGF